MRSNNYKIELLDFCSFLDYIGAGPSTTIDSDRISIHNFFSENDLYRKKNLSPLPSFHPASSLPPSCPSSLLSSLPPLSSAMLQESIVPLVDYQDRKGDELLELLRDGGRNQSGKDDEMSCSQSASAQRPLPRKNKSVGDFVSMSLSQPGGDSDIL